jgi:hypothetical protein
MTPFLLSLLLVAGRQLCAVLSIGTAPLETRDWAKSIINIW